MVKEILFRLLLILLTILLLYVLVKWKMQGQLSFLKILLVMAGFYGIVTLLALIYMGDYSLEALVVWAAVTVLFAIIAVPVSVILWILLVKLR